MKCFRLLFAAIAFPITAEAIYKGPNCGALVSMADGTFQPIAQVKVGDLVLTGTDKGQGVVTDKVANPVFEDDEQEVIVVTTAFGELVGTENQPFPLNGEWRLLGNTADFEQVPAAWSQFISKMERNQRSIDVWYDLQIDGGFDDDESSNSYVVRGLVVYGKLQDNFDFSAHNK
jgi:hypothetical protein